MEVLLENPTRVSLIHKNFLTKKETKLTYKNFLTKKETKFTNFRR